jgi:hypothetical protein
VKRGTSSIVIGRLQEVLLKYQEGTANLTTATNLLQRSVELCEKESEKQESISWIENRLLNEPLPVDVWNLEARPVPIFPLILRTWTHLGDTKKLCKFLLDPADYSLSVFSSSWARWKCSELIYAMSSEPLRFSKPTLTFIKQRCVEISSQLPPNLPVSPVSIREEIARLARTVALAELAHMEYSIRLQESKSIQEQPSARRGSESPVTRRNAIVRRLMAGKADFKNSRKLDALIAALDEQKIPLPRRASGEPRHGTYAAAKGNATWRKILETLKRDLNKRYKST